MIRHVVPARIRRAINVLVGREDVAASGDADPPGLLAVESQAYWSGSQTEDYKRDMSHWRGAGRWADEHEWLKMGEDHFGLYKTLLQLAERPEPVRSMVEWGPGGGVNAARFGQEIPKFYGVDISSPNLAECGREVEASGYGGFVPVLIDAAYPESVVDRIGEKVDLFLSTAVYQHFPGKEYGVRVNRVAHQLLANQGIALIQTRYDDGGHLFAPKSNDYHKNAIVFTSYRVEEFWQLATDAGFRPLAVLLRPRTNYAFYMLSKT